MDDSAFGFLIGVILSKIVETPSQVRELVFSIGGKGDIGKPMVMTSSRKYQSNGLHRHG